MGIAQARAWLAAFNRADDIIEFAVSSATVELAAQALRTDPASIAKSLAFKAGGRVLLVVAAGDRKVDNAKYKAAFGCKAVMLAPGEAGQLVGHEVGGICPFGVKPGVEVYLDVSLRAHDVVYPACGSANSAIRLDLAELETLSRAARWVDVCKAQPV
ncbi:MAG: EBSC protein [Spirochaetes bacterium GWD1_61_31]|nr:MAG: EBSC protein [Spirochaetes bacterium GWB1_60_80]OHD29040.1 MAG: EBSC protein [Spirochaetes bacterium GWC1_61_12]OHD35597.1 MAG: EBSC protein [Spirochaetes bacterium GWD1_61_31]OHD44206.1 MAG: EBSC protein [Spirochaetes bacterium GWE1_60_18]OHD60434.1 MAG: EBSC protein [Spirochaetes bacterium GWF1_60_12]HAP44462.1 EBSC protein [Spirochaetaceae bacterium]